MKLSFKSSDKIKAIKSGENFVFSFWLILSVSSSLIRMMGRSVDCIYSGKIFALSPALINLNEL